MLVLNVFYRSRDRHASSRLDRVDGYLVLSRPEAYRVVVHIVSERGRCSVV